ncbi:helix-turn-helix domain-containing protein [Streptomyces sp. NPDC090994]|uniref:MmyB family transcriptional regulator n=1 Tax=Streptomyces sp. NPDC090994 TaxID=3365969 RepID=UPI003801FD65
MPDDRPQNKQQPTLTRILRKARQRVDPHSVPEVVAALGPRNGPGLTQAEVAHLLGVSVKWYRSLELGKPLTFSKGLLENVARILNLSADEWSTVWRLTHGRLSSDTDRAPSYHRTPPAAVQRFVEGQPWPAYLCDHRWDLMAYNKEAAQDFPWVLDGANVMMWALTDPEARRLLVEWEDDWAPAPMALLQLQAELRSDDAGLQSIIRAVHADAVARRLWNSTALPTVSRLKSDCPRRILLPRKGKEPFWVSLLTAPIDDMPSCHLTAVIPAAPRRRAAPPRPQP